MAGRGSALCCTSLPENFPDPSLCTPLLEPYGEIFFYLVSAMGLHSKTIRCPTAEHWSWENPPLLRIFTTTVIMNVSDVCVIVLVSNSR